MADLSSETEHAPYGPLPRGGIVHPITRWGEDVMHRVQQPVTAYDDELARLVADMVETMYAADGVGLAACQIGVDRAVFVFDCPDDDGQRTVGVVCNPELITARGQGPQARRGRRGLPVLPGRVRRVRAPGLRHRAPAPAWTAAPVEFSGTGMLARCLQHETDHTQGTVFGDRLPTKLRKRLQKAMEKAADDFPLDWPAE